jgi:hypothetical protein
MDLKVHYIKMNVLYINNKPYNSPISLEYNFFKLIHAYHYNLSMYINTTRKCRKFKIKINDKSLIITLINLLIL